MATTFPLSTYPLTQRTRFVEKDNVARDVMDDGSMRVRVLGDDTHRLIRCSFAPMDDATADTFHGYVLTNRVTEFDLTYNTVTYRGYIWSSINESKPSGLHIFTFDFRGLVV